MPPKKSPPERAAGSSTTKISTSNEKSEKGKKRRSDEDAEGQEKPKRRSPREGQANATSPKKRKSDEDAKGATSPKKRSIENKEAKVPKKRKSQEEADRLRAEHLKEEQRANQEFDDTYRLHFPPDLKNQKIAPQPKLERIPLSVYRRIRGAIGVEQPEKRWPVLHREWRRDREFTLVKVEEVLKKAQNDILSDQKILLELLRTDEQTITSLWTKFPPRKRAKLLAEVWPAMAKSTRPDVEAFLAHPTVNANLPNHYYYTSYMWPYLNVEDLSKTETSLLLMLDARARNHPQVFAGPDAWASNFAGELGVIKPFEIDPLINVVVLRSDGRPDQLYGPLKPRTGRKRDFFLISEAFTVFEKYRMAYRFLRLMAQTILQDPQADNHRALSTESGSKPTQSPTSRDLGKFVSLEDIARVRICQPLKSIDLYKWYPVIEAKEDEARDHIWQLRENPGHYIATVKEFVECVAESVHGLKFLGESPENIKAKINRQSVRDAIKIACYALDLWSFLRVSLEQLEFLIKQEESTQVTASGLSISKTLHEALTIFHAAFSCYQDRPISIVRTFLLVSPPLCHILRNRSKEILKKRKKKAKKVGASDRQTFDEAAEEEEERSRGEGLDIDEGDLWVEKLSAQVAKGVDYRILRMFTILGNLSIEPQQATQIVLSEVSKMDADPAIRKQDLFTPLMREAFDNLALLQELTFQVEKILGTAFLWTTTSKAKDMVLRMRLERDLQQNFRFSKQTLNLGCLDNGRFDWPATMRRTKAVVQRVQLVESQLDEFWAAAAKEMRDVHKLLPEINEVLGLGMERTPDWVPTTKSSGDKPKGKKKSSSSPTNAMHALTMEEPEKFKKPRPKKKKEGEEDEDEEEGTKRKTRGVPDPNRLVEPEPEPEPEVEPEEITFEVDKNTYEVFALVFYDPLGRGGKSVLKWPDFMHAMSAIGFSISSVGGSAIQFTPPKELSGKRAVIFHEPHGSRNGGSDFHGPRGIGRRLTNTYGFTLDTFILK